MVHLDQSIRRRWMSFRETGYADSKSPRIRMCARFVESSNELYQVNCVLERVSRFIVSNVLGTISPESENVPNRRLGVSKQNVLDLFFIMTDARQVRDRIQLCRVLNTLDEIVS